MNTFNGLHADLIPMDELRKTARSFGMVAHPIRYRILDFLEVSDKPERVTEIVEACEGASQPIVSQQIKLLLDAGLLSRKRQGNCIYYGLQSRELSYLLEQVRIFSEEVGEE